MEIVKFAKAINKYPCSLVFDKSMNPEDKRVCWHCGWNEKDAKLRLSSTKDKITIIPVKRQERDD